MEISQSSALVTTPPRKLSICFSNALGQEMLRYRGILGQNEPILGLKGKRQREVATLATLFCVAIIKTFLRLLGINTAPEDDMEASFSGDLEGEVQGTRHIVIKVSRSFTQELLEREGIIAIGEVPESVAHDPLRLPKVFQLVILMKDLLHQVISPQEEVDRIIVDFGIGDLTYGPEIYESIKSNWTVDQNLMKESIWELSNMDSGPGMVFSDYIEQVFVSKAKLIEIELRSEGEKNLAFFIAQLDAIATDANSSALTYCPLNPGLVPWLKARI